MSEIDEVLDAYTGAGSGPNEEHIVIGRDRFVTVPEALKRIAIQYDHNVETLIFDCPRYWDEHDLSKLNIYINYMRADGTPDAYDATESIKEDETNKDIFHFEWTVSNNVTLAEGRVLFLVCAKATDEEGNDIVRWNSEPNEDTYISKGLDTRKTVETLYPDIINQLLTRMNLFEDKFDPKNIIEIEETVNNIVDGTTVVGKAAADEDGNNIKDTYATKDELKGLSNDIQDTCATKAELEGLSNDIQETYATKDELDELKENGWGGGSSDCNCEDDIAAIQEEIATIKDTYATKEELGSAGGSGGDYAEEIDHILDGTTPVGVAKALMGALTGTKYNVEFPTQDEYNLLKQAEELRSDTIYIIEDDGATIAKLTSDIEANKSDMTTRFSAWGLKTEPTEITATAESTLSGAWSGTGIYYFRLLHDGTHHSLGYMQIVDKTSKQVSGLTANMSSKSLNDIRWFQVRVEADYVYVDCYKMNYAATTVDVNKQDNWTADGTKLYIYKVSD